MLSWSRRSINTVIVASSWSSIFTLPALMMHGQTQIKLTLFLCHKLVSEEWKTGTLEQTVKLNCCTYFPLTSSYSIRYWKGCKTIPWPKQLIAGLPSLKPKIIPRPVFMGGVVQKLILDMFSSSISVSFHQYTIFVNLSQLLCKGSASLNNIHHVLWEVIYVRWESHKLIKHI
jgi:hypothetical protein